MGRVSISKKTQNQILMESKRRCALCFGIDGNFSEKKGQIAHIDQNNENSNESNLAWLCLEHHDAFDSKTSQSKNYTKEEVVNYKKSLILKIKNLSENDQSQLRGFINKYDVFFRYIDEPIYDFRIEVEEYNEIKSAILDFSMFYFESKDVKVYLDEISNSLNRILGIYDNYDYERNQSFIHYVGEQGCRDKYKDLCTAELENIISNYNKLRELI
ncbi:hypothetical protein [Photobacterium sanguinicancri]|uniref:hypothetical protein n=1 Tax=Photobacterium sanguinicancri TaxID=875932 RepID=UPI0021C4A34F|nr:hypothetical protein [Photobacterium sanguinicancri]